MHRHSAPAIKTPSDQLYRADGIDKMATMSKQFGYQCEFLDEVSNDYICGRCKYVAKEASITICCGETFCKECLATAIQNGEPCPSCNKTGTTAVQQAKYQKAILSLGVICVMKCHGCVWNGKLENLVLHLENCEFVEVTCPRNCNQKVQKWNIMQHLTNECVERDYTCPHCNYKATFKIVTVDHRDVCLYYPLQCPNRCGVSCEREMMEDHMRMCCLEKVSCDFSDVGCNEKFLRQDEDAHLDKNTQKHLRLTAAATKNSTSIQEEQLHEEIRKEVEKQLDGLKEELQKQREEFEHKHQELVISFEHNLAQQGQVFTEYSQAKEEQIRALKDEVQAKDTELRQMIKIKSREIQQLHYDGGILPYNITLFKYQEIKSSNRGLDSQAMYSHPGGYRFILRTHPCGLHGNRGTHLSVEIFSVKGDFDNNLIFPAKFTITLQLCNQYHDQDHYTTDIGCHGREKTRLAVTSHLISNADLEWNPHKKTQYLKEDRLVFRITKIIVHLNGH